MSRIERFKGNKKIYYYETRKVVEVSLHDAFPQDAEDDGHGDARRDSEPFELPDSIIDAENFIMELSPSQVMLFTFKYLGYKPREIRDFMGFRTLEDVSELELSLRKDAMELMKANHFG